MKNPQAPASSREHLRSALKDYEQKYPEECAVIHRARELLDLAHCFERELLEWHFTASAWIINWEQTHVLLARHKKLGMWVQLGGHADGDDNLWNVALREGREESGLQDLSFVSRQPFDVDIHNIPAHDTVPTHQHFDVAFLLRSGNADKIICSDEAHELRWVPFDELAHYSTEARIFRMAEKCRNFYRQQI